MLPSVGDSGLDPTPLPPRVRVRVRSIGGRFLAVLPGDSSHPARLCLTFAAPDPHRADHSLQAFALEALPDSDRWGGRSYLPAIRVAPGLGYGRAPLPPHRGCTRYLAPGRVSTRGPPCSLVWWPAREGRPNVIYRKLT